MNNQEKKQYLQIPVNLHEHYVNDFEWKMRLYISISSNILNIWSSLYGGEGPENKRYMITFSISFINEKKFKKYQKKELCLGS